MEPINVLIIAAVYFITTFFGSMIGGAALITIPALIFFGLSPHVAIGTNKIGSLGQASGATLGYGMEKKIDYKFGFILMFFGVIGTIFGSITVISVPESIIKKVIGIMMIIISMTFFFKSDFGTKTKKKKNGIWLLILFALLGGFYGGFYGAGLGIINRFVLSAFFSYALINSSALSGFANTVSSIFSLVVFSIYGVVQYSLFIPILAASLIGGFLGAKYAVKIDNINVKRILLAAAVIMAIRLLFF